MIPQLIITDFLIICTEKILKLGGNVAVTRIYLGTTLTPTYSLGVEPGITVLVSQYANIKFI